MSPELLARYDGWLRQLVARLVGDDADDVLQEVRLAAIHRGPRERQALPAWLATVARRLAGRQRRGDARRRGREQAVAGSDVDAPQFDPASLVQRIEERQRIAALVLQLDEPFRSVVLLRYFEDLTPGEIAQRTGAPVATVRTRLFRAHQLLRERFEREHGRDWRAVLLLACPLPEGAATASSAAAPVLLAMVALPLLALGSWWWFDARPDTALLQVIDTRAATATTSEVAADAPRDEPTPRALIEQQEPDTPTPATPPTTRVVGRAFHFDGAPLPQNALVFVPQRDGEAIDVGTTDHDGHFDVQVPAGTAGHIETGGEFVTLRTWPLGDRQDRSGIEAMVIAAPAVRVAGVVIDSRGTPVPDQDVAVHVGDAFGFPLPAAACGHVARWPSTRTDGNGAFELRRVPGFPFGDLWVSRTMSFTVVPLPSSDTTDLRIQLGSGPMQGPTQPRPVIATETWIEVRGNVTDQHGEPIVDAIVREPRRSHGGTTSDKRGRFALRARVSAQHDVALVAAATGFAPRTFRIPVVDGGATECTLALGTNGASLTGRVTDAGGRPLAGAIVMLADATPTNELMPSTAIEGSAHHTYGPHSLAGDDGAFTITPVLERPYMLRVAELSSGYAKTFGPFQPGAPCTITVPQRRARPQLRIVVVDRAGVVVPDVRVRCSVTAQHLRTEDGGFTSTTSLSMELDATTDAGGVLIYPEAPAGDLRLRLQKPCFEPAELTLAADGGDEVRITLLRHVPLRVATSGLDQRFVKLVLLDANGQPLRIRQPWQGAFHASGWQFGVHRGHSVVGAVVETAVRAELRDIFSNELLRAMPFVPVRDGVTVFDFPQ